MTDHWHQMDAAAAYVAGRLPTADRDAFEEHLLSCESCRGEVRAGARARRGLTAIGAKASPQRRYAVAGALLAASMVVALLYQDRAAQSRLAAFEPPSFAGGAARSAGDSAVALVDAGMRAYVAGEYRSAAATLARATQTDPSPAVAFYLGSALLADGQAERAINAFTYAQQPSGNPYAEEAALYAAKAWLRLRRADSAISLLERAAGPGVTGQRMRALADSVRHR